MIGENVHKVIEVYYCAEPVKFQVFICEHLLNQIWIVRESEKSQTFHEVFSFIFFIKNNYMCQGSSQLLHDICKISI